MPVPVPCLMLVCNKANSAGPRVMATVKPKNKPSKRGWSMPDYSKKIFNNLSAGKGIKKSA